MCLNSRLLKAEAVRFLLRYHDRIVRFIQAAQSILILAVVQTLLGCGSIIRPDYNALNGNWLLTGNRQSGQYPFLSTSLFVSGNQITAIGDTVSAPCGPVQFIAAGANILAGEVQSDGSFQLKNAGATQSSKTQIVIDGKLTTSSSWKGSYSITNASPPTGCPASQTGSFTATPIAPISGTYTGTLTPPLVQSKSNTLTVSLSVSQGQFSSFPISPTASFYFPSLSGTISVSGPPCSAQGISDPTLGGEVGGDHVNATFNMSDGSRLAVNGFVSLPDQSHITAEAYFLSGSQCNNVLYAGTLIRQ